MSMDDLAAARARRLDVIMQILETCQDMGQAVDVETVSLLLNDLADTCGPEPEKPKQLTSEELRAWCGIDGALKALCDVAEQLSNCYQGGRKQRKLRELRTMIFKEFWQPEVSQLSKEDRAQFTAETLSWGYALWPPEVQIGLLDILDRAARGAYIPKDLREGAGLLYQMLNNTMPMGRRKEASHRASTTGGGTETQDPSSAR